MGAIVIQPQNQSELDLVSEMLSKMRIKTMFISDSQIEMSGLINAIEAGRKSKKVDISLAKQLLQ